LCHVRADEARSPEDQDPHDPSLAHASAIKRAFAERRSAGKSYERET
jgi:hypothetical protein